MHTITVKSLKGGDYHLDIDGSRDQRLSPDSPTRCSSMFEVSAVRCVGVACTNCASDKLSRLHPRNPISKLPTYGDNNQ
ncbi:hypothetical protein J6590_045274 [Homalodisca vitripennis]|nr:hypothetical protein J6590_045274 [Homalodisca vitripennis]